MNLFTRLESRLQEVLDNPNQIRGPREGVSAAIYSILLKNDKFTGLVEFCLQQTLFKLLVQWHRFAYYGLAILRRSTEIPREFLKEICDMTQDYLEGRRNLICIG